jgi:hypothetical protein
VGDATRIVVAQNARVYLAPVGTTAPTSAVSVLDAAWKEVGLFTPDSLKFATDPSFEEVRSHQSNYPTRRFQTQDAATVEVDLQEWSGNNFLAVYGGGTLTSPSAGVYKFTPPSIGARIDVAAIVEIVDGGKTYRRIIPRCTQTEGVEQSFTRTAESTLPLRLSVLGSDVGDPWYDLSNDPLFDPANATLDNPYFTSATPNTGLAAAGGTVVTVTGGNLTGATGVTVGGVAGTAFSVISGTTLVFTTPATSGMTPPGTGAKALIIAHPSGNITVAGALTFL